MRKTLLLAVVAISAFALVMTSATPSEAVHAGSGQLACGQCHTMHSSQGDTNMGDVGGTGSDILLRSAKVYELCLSCHGTAGSASTDTFANDVGTPITPPKVWTQNLGNWGGKDFVSGIGAGGDFDYTGTTDGAGQITAYYAGDDPASNESLGYGHSIGNVATIPPGAAEGSIDELSCTNCHDPHGTKTQPLIATANVQGINVYRMLKVKPVGGDGTDLLETTGVVFEDGASTVGTTVVSWVGGASQASDGAIGGNLDGETPTGLNHYWPIYYAGEHNVYGGGLNSANTGDAGMSGWCSQCHDDWHETGGTDDNTTVGGTDWDRHPVNCDMTTDAVDGCALAGTSAGGATIYDYTHYNTTVVASDGKVPMAKGTLVDVVPGDYATEVYYGDNPNDRIMCLTCHFAHAGPNLDALRWDYTSAVSAGSQNGVSLDSLTGCQQCHNRGK